MGIVRFDPECVRVAVRREMLAALGRYSQGEVERIASGRRRHHTEVLDHWYQAAARAELARREALS